MKNSKYILEVSPHIKSVNTVPSIMLNVIVALIPALIVSSIIFGTRVILLTGISVGCCVLAEHLYSLLIKKPTTIKNLSAVITGILFAYTLPVSIPIWVLIIGSIFSIVFGKLIFGGLGHNPFNPALIGRAFLFISWPKYMNTWYKPFYHKICDTATYATPLGINKIGSSLDLPNCTELFLGIKAGSFGEVSCIAIVLGGAYLLLKRVISWQVPFFYIATVFLVSIFFGENPFFQIYTGGLFLGAFFMATDYSTSPIFSLNKIIFAIGCGIITCLIRFKGAFPEGVCFAILIMNMFTPILDYYIKPKRFF
jgi:Na+-translocating ferredoxin:NAD+ oxidoreductase subunit D